MGILLCEQNFRDVWRRNKSVRGEIGKILRTHKHTHAAKLVVRICMILMIKFIYDQIFYFIIKKNIKMHTLDFKSILIYFVILQSRISCLGHL